MNGDSNPGMTRSFKGAKGGWEIISLWTILSPGADPVKPITVVINFVAKLPHFHPSLF
jgi:hypothetical protein